MMSSPGAFEAQLVEFSGWGAGPDVIKQMLIFDAPTELSFGFDGKGRVHRYFMLGEW